MIEDGRAFGSVIATKQLLKLLVQKSVISQDDVEKLHDEAQTEPRGLSRAVQ